MPGPSTASLQPPGWGWWCFCLNPLSEAMQDLFTMSLQAELPAAAGEHGAQAGWAAVS